MHFTIMTELYCCVYYLFFCVVFITSLFIWLQAYKVGEHILARWTDCKMYPAKVIAVNDNGELTFSTSTLFY